MIRFLIIPILIFLFTCNTNEQASLKTTQKQEGDTILYTTNHKPVTLFNAEKPFVIVNAERTITKASSAPDTMICKGWSLTSEEAAQIIKTAEPIDAGIWHYSFSVLPCIVKGEIKQNNNNFSFTINAGSWVYIASADTSVYYSNYKKENTKYFIEQVFIEN